MRALPASLLNVPQRVRARLQQIVEKTNLNPLELWRIQSLAVRLTADKAARKAYLAGLTEDEEEELKYVWRFWARKDQLPPAGRWYIWLLLAGRGFGKTRTGSEWFLERARAMPDGRGALIGPTAGDVRDTMVFGKSGLVKRSPPDFAPDYEPSKRLLTWPNGFEALTYSADTPERLRGPEFHIFWADELGAWRFAEYAWEMVEHCHRLDYGEIQPQGVVTTTPKTIPLIRNLVKFAKRDHTAITRGTSFANLFHLSAKFFRKLIGSLGSRLSLQEAMGVLLEDLQGALWRPEMIPHVDHPPELARIVVGVDPAEEDKPTSDEIGIVVNGLGVDGKGYCLEDYSLQGAPHIWGRRVLDAYRDHKADAIVAEVNSGGKMVRQVIMSCLASGEAPPHIIEVRAKRAKRTRAEPVAALYSVGRYAHVGTHAYLESEMTNWIPGVRGSSPDNRMDAHVWGATALIVSPQYATGHAEQPDAFRHDPYGDDEDEEDAVFA